MRLDGNAPPTSRIGVRRSCKVHGPDARPKLELGAAHELGRADLPVGQDARQRVPIQFIGGCVKTYAEAERSLEPWAKPRTTRGTLAKFPLPHRGRDFGLHATACPLTPTLSPDGGEGVGAQSPFVSPRLAVAIVVASLCVLPKVLRLVLGPVSLLLQFLKR